MWFSSVVFLLEILLQNQEAPDCHKDTQAGLLRLQFKAFKVHFAFDGSQRTSVSDENLLYCPAEEKISPTSQMA